jgi:hypothetical protein
MTDVKDMTPEEKFELLQLLIKRGAEVRTYYRRWRISALEKTDSYVLIRHEKGVDKVHARDFARRRFIAVI